MVILFVGIALWVIASRITSSHNDGKSNSGNDGDEKDNNNSSNNSGNDNDDNSSNDSGNDNDTTGFGARYGAAGISIVAVYQPVSNCFIIYLQIWYFIG